MYLRAELQSTTEEEQDHISYEQIEDYVDNRADSLVREIVDGHLAHCAVCAREVRELQAFRLLVMAEATPLSEESITLVDTTGLVHFTAGRVVLTGMP